MESTKNKSIYLSRARALMFPYAPKGRPESFGL